MIPTDAFDRPLGSLRISVTDRCNLRCSYCMPEDDYVWLPRKSILTFEETVRLAAIFASLGTHRIRLTGGEPLLRHELPVLVRHLAALPQVRDLAMTTNALLLARFAGALREAGLDRVTVSLDSLRPERYRAMTRSDRLEEALQGLAAAREAGFERIKINTVVVRDVNDDEIVDLIEFGKIQDVEVRFIEYMDVGGATRWSPDRVVSRAAILERLERAYGPIGEVPDQDATAPADRFVLPDGTTFGIIASTTQPFCGTCDRSRLTADGMWYLCLYAADGINLKELVRGGASDQEIAAVIVTAWRARTDRGAELRAELSDRGVLYQIQSLRSDPRKEMHTRGG